MIHGASREELRRFYFEVRSKQRSGGALEPLEHVVARVLDRHPEYHRWLEDEDVLDRDFLPEAGESNPFLHMSLHVAIAEQLATDRPPGIRTVYAALRGAFADEHALEHAMMECLAEAMWRAQRDGGAPDDAGYLECLNALSNRRRRK